MLGFVLATIESKSRANPVLPLCLPLALILPLHIMSYPKIDSARKRNGCPRLRGCRLQWSGIDFVRIKKKLFLVSSLLNFLVDHFGGLPKAL